MATVNIIIKGIAMTYHKDDDIWKIIFPIGEGHELKFKESPEALGIALAEADRQIYITTENPITTFEIDDNYNDFLDLTGSYSHANGIRLKDGWSENAAFMTIENAKLSVYEYTETKHALLKNNQVTFAPVQIGYSAQATIESKSVTVNVNNHPDFPKVFDTDCTLIFDNDCEQGETREISDFDLAYNIIEDIETAEERFVVTKVPENIDFPVFVGTVFDSVMHEKCRDPFARGLPCHIVRVSKPENLI